LNEQPFIFSPRSISFHRKTIRQPKGKKNNEEKKIGSKTNHGLRPHPDVSGAPDGGASLGQRGRVGHPRAYRKPE
jgi:hypothetical protein